MEEAYKEFVSYLDEVGIIDLLKRVYRELIILTVILVQRGRRKELEKFIENQDKDLKITSQDRTQNKPITAKPENSQVKQTNSSITNFTEIKVEKGKTLLEIFPFNKDNFFNKNRPD